MYKYLDRPPQIGDIVEHQGTCDAHVFGVGKTLCIVTDINKRSNVIYTNIRPEEWFPSSYFKVVKTKSADEAKAGDILISLSNCNTYRSKGSLHQFIELTESGSVKYLSHKNTPENTAPSNFLVLCKAEKPQLHRNLAFYKRSKEPWTQKEYENMCNYTGSNEQHIVFKFNRFIFDNADSNPFFMGSWDRQEKNSNFKNCKQVAYEDIFPETASCSNESLTVGSHWSNRADNTDVVVILKVNSDNDVTYRKSKWQYTQTFCVNSKWFLENYKSRPDLNKPQLLHQKWKDLYDQGVELEYTLDYSIVGWHEVYGIFNQNKSSSFNDPEITYRIKPSAQDIAEPIKQQLKEKTMNKLDLKVLISIMTAMAASEEVTKDATNSEYVCIMTKDNEYEGYFYADSTEEASKVMQSPEHEGKRLHVFKYESTIAQKPRQVITVDRV